MSWRATTLWIGMLALAACTSSSTTSRDQDPRTNDSRAQPAPTVGGQDNARDGAPSTMTNSSVSSVTMTYVGQKRLRPPSSELSFDVSVHNSKDVPRWFLLPRRITATAQAVDGPISGVEVAELGDADKVVIGTFIGNPGFRALHLAAGANITIRGYTVAAAESPGPGEHALEFIACDSLTVAGEPASAWFKTAAPPTTGAIADVSELTAKAVSSRSTPDFAAVPVVVAGDVKRATISVALPAGL